MNDIFLTFQGVTAIGSKDEMYHGVETIASGALLPLSCDGCVIVSLILASVCVGLLPTLTTFWRTGSNPQACYQRAGRAVIGLSATAKEPRKHRESELSVGVLGRVVAEEKLL